MSPSCFQRFSYLVFLQVLVVCLATNIYNHNGIPCNMCPAGFHVKSHCTEFSTTVCRACPRGTFTSFDTHRKICSRCRTTCRRQNEVKVANCTKTSDIKCDCKPGYWFTYDPRSFSSKCVEHRTCEPGWGVKKLGTTKSDTVCEECPAGYYSSIYSKDYPCLKHTDCEAQGKKSKPRTGTKWSDYECIEPDNIHNELPITEIGHELKARPPSQTPDPPSERADDLSEGYPKTIRPTKNDESQAWTVKDIIFIGVAIVLAIALTVSITLFVVYRRRICSRKSFNVDKMNDMLAMENPSDTLQRDSSKAQELKDQSLPLVESTPIVYTEYELLKKSLHAPLNLSLDDPKRRGLHNMLSSFQQLDDPNAPKTPAKFIGRIRRRSNSIRSVDTIESPPASPAAANMKIAESMDSVFTFNATELNIPSNRRHLERLNSTAPTGQELPDLPLNSTVDDLFLYVSRLLGVKRWKDVIRNMPGKKVALLELDQIEATYKKDGYPEVIYQGFCNWRGKNPYHFNVLDAVTVALQKAEKVTLVERLVLSTPPKAKAHNC